MAIAKLLQMIVVRWVDWTAFAGRLDIECSADTILRMIKQSTCTKSQRVRRFGVMNDQDGANNIPNRL